MVGSEIEFIRVGCLAGWRRDFVGGKLSEKVYFTDIEGYHLWFGEGGEGGEEFGGGVDGAFIGWVRVVILSSDEVLLKL